MGEGVWFSSAVDQSAMCVIALSSVARHDAGSRGHASAIAVRSGSVGTEPPGVSESDTEPEHSPDLSVCALSGALVISKPPEKPLESSQVRVLLRPLAHPPIRPEGAAACEREPFGPPMLLDSRAGRRVEASARGRPQRESRPRHQQP